MSNQLSTDYAPDQAALDTVPQGNGDPLTSVFWRYKWVVGLCAIAGLGLGYRMYDQKPTSYRASTRLMFKSDAGLRLDATTGAIVGGLPSGTLMESLITADDVISRVAADKGLGAVPALQGKSNAAIGGIIRSGIKFQTITSSKDSKDRMIAAVSYEGSDPKLCEAAVDAMANGIEAHFDKERQSSINQFTQIIENAQGKLLPEQKSLEDQYRQFRLDAPLDWDPQGRAINPHRERQVGFQRNRQSLETQIREWLSEIKLAKSIQRRNEDPVLVLQMIGRLNGVLEKLEPAVALRKAPQQIDMDDLELERLQVERSLVPLQTTLESLIAEFGESHPSVRSARQKIESTREKLNELDKLRKDRIDELKSQLVEGVKSADELYSARAAQANRAIATYLQSLEEQIVVRGEELTELNRLIEEEKSKADMLTQHENDDTMYRRRIDRVQGMLIRLEQQMASLDLADVNNGIVVEPLLGPSRAFITGPDLKSDLTMYGMLGLALGGVLAFLFEAGAKMFRSAEEITQELRLPVLAHIPVDESRLKQATGVDDPFAKLDPKLSVVHRPHSAVTEAVRGIRTSILFDRRSYGSKVFQVTSPLPGDGKSTVSANIACSLAHSGKRVLLIDLDLRSPRLSLRFNLTGSTGLTNVLNGELSPYEVVSQTPVENLDILACGPLPANPAEALTLAELGDVFAWAREQYDFVIVDSPPLLMVTDPSIVTTYTDAALLVMRVKRRCKPNAKEAVALLRASGARVLGVVVNKVDEMSNSYRTSARGSYQSIGYGYGDKYRRRYQKEALSSDVMVVKGKSGEEGFSKPLVQASRDGDAMPTNGHSHFVDGERDDHHGSEVPARRDTDVSKHTISDDSSAV